MTALRFDPTVVDEEDRAETSEAIARARADAADMRFDRISVALMGLALSFIVLLDVVLLREIFIFLLSDSGDATFGANVLALAGVTLILGIHVVGRDSGSARFVDGLRAAAKLAIVVFLVGAGLQLALVFYQSGAGDYADSSLDSQIDAFMGDLQGGGGATWLERAFEAHVAPFVAILFVFGMGGLLIVSVLVGHVLIGAIADVARRVSRITDRNRAIDLQERKLLAAERQFNRAKMIEAAQSPADRDAEAWQTAEKISSAGLDALAAAERFLAAHAMGAAKGPSGALGTGALLPKALRRLDRAAIEARVLEIREALSVERVHALITSSAQKGEKS